MNLETAATLLILAGFPAGHVAAAGAPTPSRVATGDGTLEAGFRSPPDEAKLRCFWWWLNGNVTKAAITRDLEGMKAQGFGGAMIFDGGGADQDGNAPVPAGPPFMSEAWRELFRHAVREADRLGLELSLNIQSGWNLGGPAVTPEHAAKRVVWSALEVDGPGTGSLRLPAPTAQRGFYRDIAVVACPSPAGAAAQLPARITASSSYPGYPPENALDGNPDSQWVSAAAPLPAKPQWLQVELGAAIRLGGVRVAGRPNYGPRDCRVSVQAADGSFREILAGTIGNGQPWEPPPGAVEGRVFRFQFSGTHDSKERNVQVAELALWAAGQTNMPAARRPIRALELKTALREMGGSAPDCSGLLTDVPGTPGEEDCRREQVLDLSAQLDEKGGLQWRAPAGHWTVLRFGCTLTGAGVSTSSEGGGGLVLDYLSPDALRFYWERVVEPLIRDAGPLAGKTLKYLETDSWECGGMNWTPAFRDEFRKRRGYDLLPLLPVLAGRMVDSREASNRFLADFRKTVGDCIAENHYRLMQQLAEPHGIGIHPESGGPHGAPIDSLRCLGISDIPMSEFWAKAPRHRVTEEARFFVKQPASAAHTYGKRLVAAEGFTTIGSHWQETLWDNLKPTFDYAACEGLNRLFWCAVTCSPAETGRPGQEFFACPHFNPNVTWWNYSAPFLACLNRSQWLLQQGLFVADVVYYYGDHVPNFARLKKDDPAHVLPGYDYDVATEEVVLTRMSVRDGRIVLPDGMSYRALALPPYESISLPVLRKIRELVEAGATVVGPRPRRASGLSAGPGGDAEVGALAAALWDRPPAGQGRAIDGRTAREVLLADGVAPDFVYRSTAAHAVLDYIHRCDGRNDFYFVCNQGGDPVAADLTFRIAGRQPELWDPVTGEIRDLPEFKSTGDGRTVLPARFEPYGSMFVVFRTQGSGFGVQGSDRNFPATGTVGEIKGPWTVEFEPQWFYPCPAGATNATVVFEKLGDWTKRPEEAIRHYSGTATYRTVFDWNPEPRTPNPEPSFLLSLGKVGEMARVRLNGRDLGIVWCPPWRVAIPAGALQEKGNRLEIEVVNFWPNRIIGDAQLPPEQRRTQTNIRKLTAKTPLMPSGLLGPVMLQSAARQLVNPSKP